MTAAEFVAIGLVPGQRAAVTLTDPSGRPRTVTLFFRGYRNGRGRSSACPISEMKPAFSPPGSRGGAGRKYYTACDTSYANIESVQPL